MAKLIAFFQIVFLCLLTLGATCTTTRSYKMGVSGLSPAHWPNPTASDWVNFANNMKTDAEFLGIHAAWSDRGGFDYAVANNLKLSIVMGVRAQDAPSIDAIRVLAEEYALSPLTQYICFGNEIQDEVDWNTFANLVNSLIISVKNAKPSLPTCVVFNYESSLSRVDVSSRLSSLNVDLVVFTSYPINKGYFTPESIPNDYYAKIATWTTKPIGFSEIAWPSKSYPQLGGIPPLPGSETAQVNFLNKFNAIKPANTRWVSWFTLDDLSNWQPGDPFTNFGQVFESMALRKNDGTAKQALTTWKNALALPYVAP